MKLSGAGRAVKIIPVFPPPFVEFAPTYHVAIGAYPMPFDMLR